MSDNRTHFGKSIDARKTIDAANAADVRAKAQRRGKAAWGSDGAPLNRAARRQQKAHEKRALEARVRGRLG